MDYTKNYHLPQWVKSDRIMMDDFNRMCVDLENGLTGNRQKTNELSGQIQRVEREAQERDQVNSAAQQVILNDSLFHIAYNHYHLLAAAPAAPWQTGFFHHRLGGAINPVTANGWADVNWAIWHPHAAATYTSNDFRACFQQLSQMVIVKDNAAANRPLVIQFTPPGPGRITKMPIYAQMRNNNGSRGYWHMSFINMATGECEAETTHVSTFELHGSVNVTAVIKEPFYFSGGVTYQFVVTSEDSGYNCTIDFPNASASFAAESLNAGPTGVVAHTFQIGEAAEDGAVLVQYRTLGAGCTLALTWDGKVLSPAQTHTFVNTDGRTVREAMFRKNGAVPASTSLQLHVNCPVGQEIFLYSLGMMTV